MNLVNAEYGIDIILNEELLNEIVVENPDSFTSIVTQLSQECEGKEHEWILSEDDKILKLDKLAEFIDNPLQIDFNNRKILGKLYSSMLEICNEDVFKKNEINLVFIKHLEKIINSLPYEYVSYDMEFEWTNLFKLYNVKIEVESSSLLEKIIEYIKLLSFLCKTKIVVFLNLRSYLDVNKIAELQKMALYYKVSILLVESTEREKIPNSHMIIVDKDNCLILK